MVVLALDTTTRQGSVTVMRDGGVLGAFAGDPLVTHGERLPGDLVRALARHGLRVTDVDVFVVAAGPGSFTGLRIGIATLQGLALANNRPLVGVSALDAWNHAARVALNEHAATSSGGKSSDIAVWMDAQRGEVFSARYAGDAAIDGPTVEKPEVVLARWAAHGEPRAFVGEGATAHQRLIKDAFPDTPILVEVPLISTSVAQLGEAVARSGRAVAPDAIRPLYIRRSDAELARDRAVGLQPS